MEHWGGILFAMCIFLLIVLLCREIACWWIKTNDILKVLTEIRDELRYWRDKGKAKKGKAIDVKAELSAEGYGPQAKKK